MTVKQIPLTTAPARLRPFQTNWGVWRRPFAALALCALLTGCATSSDMVQHGNLKVQFTQTQNQWAENVVLVTTCEKLQNGFCPPDAPTQVLVVSGKLPGVVAGVGQSMTTLGAAALVRDGLVKSKSTVKQSNQTDIRASTVNPK